MNLGCGDAVQSGLDLLRDVPMWTIVSDTTGIAGSRPPTPHLTSPLPGGRDELESGATRGRRDRLGVCDCDAFC